MKYLVLSLFCLILLRCTPSLEKSKLRDFQLRNDSDSTFEIRGVLDLLMNKNMEYSLDKAVIHLKIDNKYNFNSFISASTKMSKTKEISIPIHFKVKKSEFVLKKPMNCDLEGFIILNNKKTNIQFTQDIEILNLID